MPEKSQNSRDLDQKKPGILLGTQPRNRGSCSSQKPLGSGGNRKVWKHSWDFVEVFSHFLRSQDAFSCFPICWDGGIWECCAFWSWKREVPSWIWVGKSKGRVWVWREFLEIIPIFSASFPKFGDFIHGEAWSGIPGNNSCFNPIFFHFFSSQIAAF